MKTNVVPIYGKDYAPAFSMFTVPAKDLGIISEGIIWIENQTEKISFEGLLKEYEREGLSHVTGVKDRYTIIEADQKGIHESPIAKYLDDPDYICIFREPWFLTEYDALVKIERQQSLIGNPYDFATYPGFVINAFTKLQEIIPYWKRFPMVGHIPGARVCSSLECDGFQQTKYKRFWPMSDYHCSRVHVHMQFNSPMYKPLRFDKTRL